MSNEIIKWGLIVLAGIGVTTFLALTLVFGLAVIKWWRHE